VAVAFVVTPTWVAKLPYLVAVVWTLAPEIRNAALRVDAADLCSRG
jgi:hypothetical protein